MSKLDRSQLIKKGKVSIDGLDSMVAAFRELAGDKSDTKLVQAMRYALQPLQKQVKANAPRMKTNKHKDGRTGLLRKSIGLKAKKFGRGHKKKIFGLVGPKLSTMMIVGRKNKKITPAKYAHLVERGAAPHTIRPKNKAILKSWQHPGAKAKPFMKPALAVVGSQIYTRFMIKMSEIISRVGVKK